MPDRLRHDSRSPRRISHDAPLAYKGGIDVAASCLHATASRLANRMSFGTMFTLRTRARQAKPEAADEPFPATAGWNERRTRVAAEPGTGTPKRRTGDKPRQEPRGR